MFFQRPNMTSTYDSAERIATPSWIGFGLWANTENAGFTTVLTRERSKCRPITNQSSFKENSGSSSSHFRGSAEKLAAVFSHKRVSSQETPSDREGISSGHQPVQGKDEILFRFSDPEEAARFGSWRTKRSSTRRSKIRNLEGRV